MSNKEISNILTCMEITTKEFKDRMEILNEKLEKYSQDIDSISKENIDHLKKIYEIAGGII